MTGRETEALDSNRSENALGCGVNDAFATWRFELVPPFARV